MLRFSRRPRPSSVPVFERDAGATRLALATSLSFDAGGGRAAPGTQKTRWDLEPGFGASNECRRPTAAPADVPASLS